MSPSFAPWILSALTALVPPEAAASAPSPDGVQETAEARRARYGALASAISTVVLDPEEAPAFQGAHGRARTAALLVAVARLESNLDRDIDVGPCYRGPGNALRCDRGRSACVFQIHIGAGRTEEGWTQADLFADREKCARAALHRVRRSFGACRRHAPSAWLNVYASGRCDAGGEAGRARLALGDLLFWRWQRGFYAVAAAPGS